MTTETMTIHRALAELKVLENRINKTISDAKFCAAVKQSMKKVNGVSLEDFKVGSQSSLDTIRDLIARQEAIKKAISVSKAEPWKNEDGERVNTGVDILNGKASIFLSNQKVEIAHVHAQED